MARWTSSQERQAKSQLAQVMLGAMLYSDSSRLPQFIQDKRSKILDRVSAGNERSLNGEQSRKPRSREEEADQMRFIVWLAERSIRHHASPNGARRSMQQGAKLKRMGMSAGFPDVEIPYPRGKYHGLYIELKRESGGVISPAQREWLNHLRAEGYAAMVAKGYAEAVDITERYFALGKFCV